MHAPYFLYTHMQDDEAYIKAYNSSVLNSAPPSPTPHKSPQPHPHTTLIPTPPPPPKPPPPPPNPHPQSTRPFPPFYNILFPLNANAARIERTQLRQAWCCSSLSFQSPLSKKITNSLFPVPTIEEEKYGNGFHGRVSLSQETSPQTKHTQKIGGSL